MKKALLILFLLCNVLAYAQQPVRIGGGSYAAYTPLYKSRTTDRGGDQSYLMENRKLYITDKNIGKTIPTNDWWTDLLVSQYSGNLWAYPQVVKAEQYGFFVAYPKEWEATGHELKWKSQIEVSGVGFKPDAANANNWHDWGIDFLMKDGNKEMLITLAHGIPFTWVETKNLTLQLNIATGIVNDGNGQVLPLPYTGNSLMVDIGGDIYGIYAPDNTRFSVKNGLLQIEFQGAAQFLSIGVLPSKQDFATYANYAYTIPRNTTVSWNYNETTGKVTTNWTLQTENLAGQPQLNVLQGFIPHHYKNTNLNFSFTGAVYQTPRGKMKMAAGNSFSIEYQFNGILPFFAKPLPNETLTNPYQRMRMKQMIADYANNGNFGGDTYWGGKGLIQMAMYMSFAHEMGETELFEKCKTRLKDVLVNWLTYTPGENSYFFAKYPRWGSLVGYDTSYDSDTFNDHHFHYGYFTLASAMLALFDEDFKANYGDMATLVAKDYANWDKNDTDFPLFRTLDPWAGHSYAGGVGGGNGNGQESTSESMQGWGGVYLLGVATGNKAMRDAGIFGWTLEARGTAEYWFDRDKENIDYTKYTRPYNSNLTSQGIGWWTWFSGDPVWMHSIQWLPISPALKYLYEDLNFAEWDYKQMWDKKEIRGWETQTGLTPSALSYESGIGNVVMSYLQVFNPDSAAAVFDKMWDAQMPVARNHDTGGITYFLTHSHRTYGDISWDIHANMPTATTYKHPVTGVFTYMVYNPDNSQKKVKFYRNGAEILEINAPPNKLTVYSDAPIPSEIKITLENGLTVQPNANRLLKATVFDQYGATMEGHVFQWSSTEGSIDANGTFTAPVTKGNSTVTVSSGSLSASVDLRIDDLPQLAAGKLLPDNQNYIEKGKTVNFSLSLKNQYNEAYHANVSWQILKGTNQVKADSVFNLQEVGIYTVRATVENQVFEQQVYLTPKFRNIALGKNAYSSSEENAGTLTRYATDGSYTTRWGSAHSNPQWIYVDLQQGSFVGYVSLVWEAAYSSQYELQISNDGQNWETIKAVNGLGKTELIEVNRTTRYVRMYGLARATTYGHSLYEFEIYGIPPVGSTPTLLGIDVSPYFAQIKEGQTIAVVAKGYDQFGNEIQINPQYSIKEGTGVINQNGSFTPSKYGNAVITVEENGLQANAKFIVEETVKLSNIVISPKTTQLIKGETVSFSVLAKDQFGVEFSNSGITYQIIEGNGGSLLTNSFTSNNVGDYKIVAGSANVKDTAVVVVSELAEVNLALNKPIIASSNENDATLARYANDGQLTTRWGSTFKNNEYIQLDLLENYIINKIKLFWDPAYAKTYQILVSTDGENWTNAYQQNNSNGGTEIINLNALGARYIRLVALTRATGYGASINEFEVYGTSFWRNPVAQNIVITPSPLIAYVGDNLAISAQLLDQYQMPFTAASAFDWQTNGGGTINAQGNFNATNVGDFIVTIKYGALSVDFPITVRASKVLTKLEVGPKNIALKTGENQQFTVRALDQYDNDMVVNNMTWSSNGGAISSLGEFSSNVNGVFEIKATSSNVEGKVNVQVFTPDNLNIALRKPILSSSGAGSVAQAVDGNDGSRWESVHGSDLEWFYVDLQSIYSITDLDILWEGASAKDYQIQVSSDAQNWITILDVKDKTVPGIRRDVWRVQGTGRYLRLLCTKRLTVWGFSVFELKAYGILATSVLPVGYLSFDAKKSQNGISLAWKTAQEISNEKFIVEKSENGADFKEVGMVLGNQNATTIRSYNWLDRRPLTGHNYYRLRQVDLNGEFEYSAIKVVNYITNDEITLYPNPITNFFHLKGIPQGTYSFKIFNTLGILVYGGNIVDGTAKIGVLENGVYTLQVADKEKNVVYRNKIVVQH